MNKISLLLLTVIATAPARAATFTLSISTAGPMTTGTVVTSSPTGISCPSTCTAVFTASATIVLTAVVPSTMAFSNWGLVYCRSNSPVCTFNITQNTNLVATYNPTLDISFSGSGLGIVTSSGGISLTNDAGGWGAGGAVSRMIFPTGSTMTLSESTGAYSSFTGWSGDAGCSTASTCSFTLNGYRHIVATFTAAAAEYPLLVVIRPTGGGTITSSPAGISCPGVCRSTFTANAFVTLTTAAASGYRFGGWANGGCSKNLPCVVQSTSPLQGLGRKESPTAYFYPSP